MTRLSLYLNRKAFLIFFLSAVVLSTLGIFYYYPLFHWGFKYMGVAYQMWHQHEFWYPIWGNNALNVQKGPLFYWLINLCWGLFGLNRVFPIAIIAVFYVLTGIFVYKISQLIHQSNRYAQISLLIFASNFYILDYLIQIRFDIQLMFCATMGIYYLIKSLQCNNAKNWLGFVIAAILGLLFKGPVIFIFFVPFAVLALLTHKSDVKKSHWALGFMLATIISLLITAVWFLVANNKTHGAYLQTLFSQTLQRFSHTHPDPIRPGHTTHWHYYSFLNYFLSYCGVIFTGFLIFLIPLWKQFKYIKNFIYFNNTSTLLFYAVIASTLFFSLFVGQQIQHYMYPLIPFTSILFVNLLASSPEGFEYQWRSVKWVSVFILIWYLLHITLPLIRFHESQTITLSIHQLQQVNRKPYKPVIVIDNDPSRFSTGWARLLAKNIDIERITVSQFNDLKPNELQKRWCIIWRAPKQFAQYETKYLLQFPRSEHHQVQLLVPCESA